MEAPVKGLEGYSVVDEVTFEIISRACKVSPDSFGIIGTTAHGAPRRTFYRRDWWCFRDYMEKCAVMSTCAVGREGAL